MRQNLKNIMPYLLILAIDFYLLPVLIRNTGLAMLLMLCIIPFIAFITAIIVGIRQGFNLWLTIAATILFIPTIFIHYNISAWVYAPVYGMIVLFGNLLGRMFYGQR